MSQKLKAVPRKFQEKDFDGDMYHRCRWCHHFNNGCCEHPDNIEMFGCYMNADHDGWFIHVSEEGKVQETLKESMGGKELETFKTSILSWLQDNTKISETKMRQLKEEMDNWQEELILNLSEKMDSDLCESLYGYELTWGDEGGCRITRPSEFWCSRWL